MADESKYYKLSKTELELNEISKRKKALWKEMMDIATSEEINTPEGRKKHDKLRAEYFKLHQRQWKKGLAMVGIHNAE